MEDIDRLSLLICKSLRVGHEELASTVGPVGNIFSAFFHDLVVHFSGIIIHRNTSQGSGKPVNFPWVNRDYSLCPSELKISPLPNALDSSRSLKAKIYRSELLPITMGRSIPGSGGRLGAFERKILRALLSDAHGEKFFLPNLRAQISAVNDLIIGICKEYEITNPNNIVKNWETYIRLHTSNYQEKITQKGALVGTRNNLKNRKIALNFLQQNKEVVGFTHGELSNQIFDEPVYSYSDRSLCSTLIEYGRFRSEKESFTPLIRPTKEIRRSSTILQRMYSRSDQIRRVNPKSEKVLLIPTMYQEDYLYGPKHAYETKKYCEWHRALESQIPNLVIKLHPKTRYLTEFLRPVEKRSLERCIQDYDLLIFDFVATGVGIALFSNKPVIYFDIGLRSLHPEFESELFRRGAVVKVDFRENWENQIAKGLEKYTDEQQSGSNVGLEKFAFAEHSHFSLGPTLVDIIQHSR